MPTSKFHTTTGEFCSTCGKLISVTSKKKYREMISPRSITYDETEKEVQHFTLGWAKLSDLKKLGNTHVICPEYLKSKKIITFAPRYFQLSDVSRSGESVNEYTPAPKTEAEWVALLERSLTRPYHR